MRPPFNLLLMLCVSAPAYAAASDYDEFRIKREAVFEFAQKPVVTREGDRVTIAFETKGFCDVTVAIEEAGGKIVRYLASGVLGPNSPEPFQKYTKKQVLVWDGKNDKGEYVDDRDELTVRVSLGVKPQFERTLNWSPERRIGAMPPAMCPAAEGVYVYEGAGLDHLRLFDHDGRYLRTIYPFASDKLDRIKDLAWFDFPQGYRLPVKGGSYQQTFLTSGDNAAKNGMGGMAATAMAVQDGRIALVHERLNRLATDGTTGGRPLLGNVDVMFPYRTYGTNADGRPRLVAPTSAAFTPDGKSLYLTGYAWRVNWHWDILNGVVRIPFEGDGPVASFVGSMKQGESGADNTRFNGAASVAVDKAGRVYVADLANDRIQVFAPDGKFLKTIPTARPAQVEIHPRTQEIYVFSWPIYTRAIWDRPFVPALTRFGPFDDPKKIAAWPLPLPAYGGRHNEWYTLPGLVFSGAVDGHTDPPTIWIAAGSAGGQGFPWGQFNIRLLRDKDGELKVVRDFGREVVRATGRPKMPCFNYQMQRLTVNPKTGHVFLAEPDSGPANKAYKQLVEFDPETGKTTLVDLPFNCEDLCFDQDGLAYLRTTDVVVRYNPQGWIERPWDYGQELPAVGCGMYGRDAPAVAGLVMPSISSVCFHQGGMAISPKGHLAVSCAYRTRDKPREYEVEATAYGKPYKPVTYPGRVMSSTGACVHIWDDRGRIVYKDAVQGMPQIDGLGLDRDDQLYVMATPTRVLDGKAYFNRSSETLMKLDPRKARFTSDSGLAAVPLPKDAAPNRPQDVVSFWVDGAQWMYGGVGFAGFNEAGCACWHARFALDYFARSFAPEMDQYRVAVLDKNGNLILHIGQYGNADDGKPLAGKGGPPNPRSIGGDEVGLFYPAFLATHTDRRLFIADAGNARILSVKLDYHATERVLLRDVPETE